MNTLVPGLLAAGILIAGLIFSPVFVRYQVAQAQAQAQARLPSAGIIGDCTDPLTGHLLPTKTVTLYAQGKTLNVSRDNLFTPGGIKYDADVFGTNATNGSIPGPLIALTQGENLRINLTNVDSEIHSLDFHMGYGTDQSNSGPVAPVTEKNAPHSKVWTICNPAPGAWFYHCSANMLNGIWKHIANGMYGGVVVHPLSEVEYQNPLKLPTREFYIVFSELFTNRVGGGYRSDQSPYTFDFAKFYNDQPDLILTNGMAFKYVPHIGDAGTPPPAPPNECTFPGQEDCTLTLDKNGTAQVFKVLPGELTRWYIFNAGPNDGVAFHFIGTYQDDYHGFDPNPALLWNQPQHRWVTCCLDSTGHSIGHLIRQDMNDQVNWIPPASGQIIQAKFPLINTTNSHNPTSQSLNPRSQENQISLYVGVDHNMNHVIKGGAFAVVAVCPGKGPVCGPLSPSDEPFGTWVPPIHSRCVLGTQNGLCPLAAVANATISSQIR